MKPSKSYSVFVAEDMLPARTLVQKFIAEHPELTLAATAKNGKEALQILSSKEYDLALLDIQLPVMSSLSVLEQLTYLPYIIFTTAYDQYAVKAFEIGAVDYLLKPFSQERFNQAIDKFLLIQKNNIPYDIYRGLQELIPPKYSKSSLSATSARKITQALIQHMEENEAYNLLSAHKECHFL